MNSKNYNPSIDYFFYIIILLLLLITIYFLFKQKYFNESFTNSSIPLSEKKPSPESLLEIQNKNLKTENEQLINLKTTLNTLLEEQSRGIYLSNNFNKIDENSFLNELSVLDNDFKKTKLPEIDISKYNVIDNEQEFEKLIEQTKTFKNIYKPGDIVTQDSDFNISKNDICYNNLHNSEEIKKYPNCMVCSINNPNTYDVQKSWKNTKTNINSLCLFNPIASESSGILNYDGCKKLCKLP